MEIKKSESIKESKRIDMFMNIGGKILESLEYGF